MVIHSLYAYILKGNAFGKGEKNAEKMRKLRWKEELIHMMDADGDGEVQPDEVLEFLTNHEKLKNDPTKTHKKTQLRQYASNFSYIEQSREITE